MRSRGDGRFDSHTVIMQKYIYIYYIVNSILEDFDIYTYK